MRVDDLGDLLHLALYLGVWFWFVSFAWKNIPGCYEELKHGLDTQNTSDIIYGAISLIANCGIVAVLLYLLLSGQLFKYADLNSF